MGFNVGEGGVEGSKGEWVLVRVREEWRSVRWSGF